MEDFINWISANKTWIFEGIGVALLTGVFAFFWNRRKKETGNSGSNTIVGNNNIQAGGNISITNQAEKKSLARPIIELELKFNGSGQKNRGLSSKNSTADATFVTEAIRHFELYWNYELIIRNNSSAVAYGLQLEFLTGRFDYIENFNSFKPIMPHGEISLKCNVTQSFEGTGKDSEKIYRRKYSDKIKKLIIVSNYKDEARQAFQSEFRLENEIQTNKINEPENIG